MVIFRCLSPEKIMSFQVDISKQCSETNINCAFFATIQVHVPTNRYRALEFKIKELIFYNITLKDFSKFRLRTGIFIVSWEVTTQVPPYAPVYPRRHEGCDKLS